MEPRTETEVQVSKKWVIWVRLVCLMPAIFFGYQFFAIIDSGIAIGRHGEKYRLMEHSLSFFSVALVKLAFCIFFIVAIAKVKPKTK